MVSFNGKSMLLDHQPIQSVFTDSCNLAAGEHLMATGSTVTGNWIGPLWLIFILTQKKF